ncbi:MAG: SPOR domain-containing protein [Crocinitomicaceae bacterium]
MNKSFIFIFTFLFSLTAHGQFEQNNKWSLDLGGGLTNAVKPYTENYFSNTYDLFHASGGVRYMFNNKYGIKLDAGYDRITNGEVGDNAISLPFQTDYFRVSMQGVANLGRLLMFENFSNHLSLLFHAGGGFSMLQNEVSFDGEDERMVNFMMGFTPQIKLGHRAALFLDASFIWHIYQQKTFDMQTPVAKRGFDGFLANATIGFNFYIGKHEEHMDWAYSPCFPDMSYLESEIKKLDSTNVVLNAKFNDDDGDGVINYLDQEKDSPNGVLVDCNGKEIGSDLATNPVPDTTQTPTPAPDVVPTPTPDSSPTPNVTPTPTSDVTPTPTPDITPTPTPDVTPTPTPDITPTPTPVVTPVPTPVVNLEATPEETEVAPLSQPYYSVIAGSFRTLVNAERKLVQLKAEGFDAAFTEVNPEGLIRVAYGRFASKREALRLHNYIRYTLKEEVWYLEEK